MTADRTESDEEVIKQLSQKVRDRIGAVSSLKQILVAKRLPKTRYVDLFADECVCIHVCAFLCIVMHVYGCILLYQ